MNVPNIKIRAKFVQWEARWCIRWKDRRTCQAYRRSSRLHETTYPVNDPYNFYISIVKPTRCTNLSNLFWNDTLHVSDGLSVHHQQFKTLHTATDICQPDTAVRLADSSICFVAVCTVFNSWWRMERPSETCSVSDVWLNVHRNSVWIRNVVLRTHPWTHYLPTGLDNLPAATAHTYARL